MKFVNRKEELAFLEKKWNENKAQLIVIYGKRRVGKTELSIHFAKDKEHIYFLCERVSSDRQLKKFTEAVGIYFKDDFLPPNGFNDWEIALRYIAKKDKKIALIIDEFPYLAETDTAVPSTFQKVWDLYLKDSKVCLILLGSSISMMEKTILFYKAPLYGRRTAQLLIKPFRIKDIIETFPEKDFEEILSIYSVVGGVPLYLSKFYGKQKWINIVEREIFTKGQPLYEEVEFLLREELREPRNYFVILEALSMGKSKISEIINETGFDKGTISRYISILDSLQITKKEIPVTENLPEKSRRGIYKIDDNFFNFWFRLIFRNRSLLEECRISEVISRLKRAMPEFLSQNYEKIAGEVLLKTIADGKISLDVERYGRWWNSNQEIDLVAINRTKNEILFGEVKWSNKQVGIDMYEDLMKKSRAVEWGKTGRKEYFALFSKSGFTTEMKIRAQKEEVFLFQKNKLVV